MRIVIDMQGAQTESRYRGIGRYTMSLAKGIVRNRGEHEVILALSGLFPDTIEPIRSAFDGMLPQESIRVWHALGPVRECELGNEWRREVAECIREAFLASLRPDVVYVSSLFEGYIDDAVTSVGSFEPHIPTVVTLYDLIPLLNSDTYLSRNPDYAKHYQKKIEHLKRAKLWLAISESAAAEGCDALGLQSDRVVNISTACDSVFRQLDIPERERQQVLAKFDIKQPFILYSGGADQRKNLRRLIQAYARLPKSLRDTHQLVLAGRVTDGDVAELKKCAKVSGLTHHQLQFTGYITDDEMVRLYNLSKIFVFPSCHEGFGMPVLEAMSCGAAAIGSNIASVKEIIGRSDALFEPLDVKSINQKLAEVISNNVFRCELIQHGKNQSKKFSWDKVARHAIVAFEFVHKLNTSDTAAVESENQYHELIRAISDVVPARISDGELRYVAQILSRNRIDRSAKQFLVDISELVQRDARTGVQRVARSILKELLESPPEGYVVQPVFATKERPGYRYARHLTSTFHSESGELDDEPIDYHHGDIFLGLDLQHHVVAAQKEYLSSLRRDGVSVYFVVYDLLPVLLPNAFLPGSDVAHKQWLETLTGFDGAVCISRSVAEELSEWQSAYGPKRLRSFKIGWFHLGADVVNSIPTRGLPDDANQVIEYFARRQTFLLVGTIEPRKGHAQVLAAFELLWKHNVDVCLVIIGKQGWMVEDVADKLRNHPERFKHLFWLEGVSDEYLEKIYSASTCLVAASEGEGFGLPLIEAAQHKLSIIARDLPVFREVAGEHAYYFGGKSPDDMAQTITEWLRLYIAGKHPRSDNIPWLTWKESAKQLIDAIFTG